MKKVYVPALDATHVLRRIKDNFYYDTIKQAEGIFGDGSRVYLVHITLVPPPDKASNKSLRRTTTRVRPSLPFKGPIQT